MCEPKSFVCWNANGLLSTPPKLNDIKLFLATHQPLILAVIETHQPPNHNTETDRIQSYNHHFFPHLHHSSGMLIYIHQSLHAIHRPDLSTRKPSTTPSMIQSFHLYFKRHTHSQPDPLIIAFTYLHPNPSDTETITIFNLFNAIASI